ncbi:UDP-4-amino-4,6-dideoxy-N-acetyl-beta-L-altrosamine transaminase [Govanella unica]|uniref:UDP-4-amino-4, 6-dideoxy-N-acetyl-beta-L-altrosamine transaminase n=1 Tax=Govanella unica TaxID=2975056 RepID=A0A9X3TZM6_9PROT|nr:UDP-4-amino-4,6-dideoxy-N-acetyl-beta-L-altrosamine transaminase [Govania unica]MDA5194710.1 UDP-4-amino-4,6-dideoxy-N-acetyl-beta-L-altrosamine transaminase [Govania unica]
MIPYARQDISDADMAAVVQVLQSDFLAQGPQIPLFEQAVAGRVGVAHALAVNSATSALHIACLALGVGPGDVVWTTPITFVASANCALYCGADVDFVDIDPRTLNMSIAALEQKLATAERLPKVVIPVHFTGEPCDMAAIGALAKRYGFAVIEDAAHAIGALADGVPVGACTHSDVTIFSFHPVKIITTGEGGMALTNRADLADRMALLRSHGITREPSRMSGPSDGGWYYQQVDLGLNYRMTELEAALGVSQLGRMDDFIDRRHALADRYDDLLADFDVVTPFRDPGHRPALHLYVLRVKNRAAVFDRMRDRGIGVNVHYIPVHTQPYYQARGFAQGDFPQAENYYAEALSLPMYPLLSDADQDRVVAALGECLA